MAESRDTKCNQYTTCVFVSPTADFRLFQREGERGEGEGVTVVTVKFTVKHQSYRDDFLTTDFLLP